MNKRPPTIVLFIVFLLTLGILNAISPEVVDPRPVVYSIPDIQERETPNLTQTEITTFISYREVVSLMKE